MSKGELIKLTHLIEKYNIQVPENENAIIRETKIKFGLLT